MRIGSTLFSLEATTASDSKRWDDSFTECLKEADVVLLYDMDKTGVERKKRLSETFIVTKRLRVVDLPDIEYQESHGKASPIGLWRGI